jgi:hypothetical protein
MIESGDAAPAPTALEVIDESCTSLNKSITAWRTLNSDTLAAANSTLEKAKLAPLPIASSLSEANADACHM